MNEPEPFLLFLLEMFCYSALARERFVLSLETLMTTYVHANKTPTKASMSHVQQEPRRFARNATDASSYQKLVKAVEDF